MKLKTVCFSFLLIFLTGCFKSSEKANVCPGTQSCCYEYESGGKNSANESSYCVKSCDKCTPKKESGRDSTQCPATIPHKTKGCINPASNIDINDSQLNNIVSLYFNSLINKNAKFYKVTNSTDSNFHACFAHCEKGDAFCEEAKITSDLMIRFDQLNKLITKDDALVKKKKIMDIFGQKIDECNRSDLYIKNGKIINVGSTNCKANFKSEGEEFGIVFPKAFEGTISFDNGISIEIDPATSPVKVTHSRPASILNGPLSFIALTDKGFFTMIGELCIHSK